MANNSITDFITKFNGGTRINRFNVAGNIGGRTTGTATPFNDFHITAASLPSAQVGAISINYRGRSISYPGDRVYAPWQIVVLDENPNGKKVIGAKTIYGAFHDWHQKINAHSSNTTVSVSPGNHFASNVWNVTQYDVNGTTPIRTFSLHNCWPLQVGPIELDMNKDNIIGSFAVTIVYSHYTLNGVN